MMINNIKPTATPERIAFKGSGLRGFAAKAHNLLPDKALGILDFKGYNMSLQTMMLFTFGIVLGARLMQARDANERREVATRDFSAISTIIFAMPLFKKATATLARNCTGFAISSGSAKKFVENLWPESGIQPASFHQLRQWYAEVEKLPKGIVTFAQNIAAKKGNLAQILNFIPDEAKKALNQIAQDTANVTEFVNKQVTTKPFSKIFNRTTEKLMIPESNEHIIRMLEKAQELAGSGNTVMAENLKKVTSALNPTNGNVIKYAEFLKSVPELASIGIIAGFLGWFLPWFNIQYTKHLYKNNNGVQPQGHDSVSFKQQINKSSAQSEQLNHIQKNIFSQFAG